MRFILDYLKHSYFAKHKFITGLCIIALFYTILLIYPNYRYECADNACGLSIVDTYFHDTFWHLSISAVSFATYPFQMPVFSGNNLQGYHYLYDLVLSILSITGIPLMFLYWRFSPLVYFALITFIAIKLGRKIADSPIFVGLLLFFIYFSGTFSYVANLVMKGSMIGYGVSSLLHTSTTVLYPTVAFSLCLVLGVMLLLYRKKMKFRDHVLLGVLLFICMGLKFYAGVSILIMVTVYEICLFFSKVKNHHLLHRFTTTFLTLTIYGLFFILSLLVFYEFPQSLSLNRDPVFSIVPLATVHPVISDEFIYGNKNLMLVRETLYANGLSPRLFALEAMTIGLFLFHNFGTRLIGFFYITWLIIKRRATAIDIASFVTMISVTVLSMILVQRGEQWWNSMQFLYYSALIASIYTARWLYEVLKTKKRWASLVVGVVILLTIPNAIEKVQEMYKTKKRAVSYAELEALSYLKKEPKGIVLSVPLMPDTAYISALTGKQTYFSDEQMLRNTGVDYAKRLEYLKRVEDLDLNSVKAKYIYALKKDENFLVMQEKANGSSYTVIFENKEVVLFSRGD